ncbi:MAG: MBL fold metallo-hydrolase [Pseudomonadota bacterium]
MTICLPVKPDWFATEDLGDGVTLITEPDMNPDVRCNMFHVRGTDRDMIVDTGLGLFSLAGSLPWLAERRIICVSSHSHFDHIGATHEFRERLIHPAEADILADPTNDATLATWLFSEMSDAEMFDPVPDAWDRSRYRLYPAPATGLIEDGDVIDLGDRQFTVLHTPGHSPGGIALFEETTGIMIAGDFLYDGDLITNAYHSNMADYHATMRGMREVSPRIVHAGHYASFGLDRYRALIDQFLQDYSDQTQAGPGTPGT